MIIWLALVLVPIFPDIELFGVKLKAQLDELKSDVRHDLAQVRAEIRSAIDIRTTVNPVFNLQPASDQQLASLREIVKEEIANHRITLQLAGVGTVTPPTPVPSEILELFTVRYNLEKELVRISETRFGQAPATRRPAGANVVIRSLSDAALLSPDLAEAIRELYAIATAGTHDRRPTTEQLTFVRDLAPTALAALKAL